MYSSMNIKIANQQTFKMHYSPKLKKALQEIKGTIQRHEIAGFVVLHTPGFREQYLKVDPKYAAVEILPDESYRIKGKSEHHKSPDERDIKVSNTLNMFMHLTEAAAQLFMHLDPVHRDIDEKYEAEHDSITRFTRADKPTEKENQFAFTAKSKITLEHHKGETSSRLAQTDLLLECSDGMDKAKYIDGDGLPTKDGLKPLTLALIQGLVASMRHGAHNGWWKEHEHMQYIIDELQRGFVTPTHDPTTGFM